MPRNSAALPILELLIFLACPDGMKMTLAGVFLTSGRGRARLLVLSSYIPVIAVESAWNTGMAERFKARLKQLNNLPFRPSLRPK